ALSPCCLRGLQFPERDGPLTGFAALPAEAANVAGQSVAEAENALGARIVAIDGATAIAADDTIAAAAALTLYAPLERLMTATPRRRHAVQRPGWRFRMRVLVQRLYGRLRHIDQYIAALAAAAIALFSVGSWHFRDSFRSDWLTAAYFVMSTITTTGYGDITPHHDDVGDVVMAMLLMLLGTIFTGVFIAAVAARLTRAQWVRMQGLRPITRRGHIVVCGCGSIGTGVIDLLLAFDMPLVVVEQNPDAALVERARDGRFDLLTGDASRDDTLDLCNLMAAHSLVALTNVDTLNLEISLGARARNPDLPIVLRIAEAGFAASIARHFQVETTFSVEALAAPVFAGLSRMPGGRGRIAIGDQEFAIIEALVDPAVEQDMARFEIPLAMVGEGGEFTLRRGFEDVPAGTRVLMLVPLAPFHDGRTSVAEIVERVYYR
ncbi:MAG: potassium channel family protein, partial [Thiohalocapsa sp.]